MLLRLQDAVDSMGFGIIYGIDAKDNVYWLDVDASDMIAGYVSMHGQHISHKDMVTIYCSVDGHIIWMYQDNQ